MKTSKQTHPWISFECKLKSAGPELWMSLGEAASKCEHLCNAPLRPSTAEKLHQLYLAKGVAATTAIEGNTLSEDDVLKAVSGELVVPPSKQYLKQEVDNIIDLCHDITTELSDGTIKQPTTDTVCEYNKRILNMLPSGDGVEPGVIRSHSVLVGDVYRGAPAEECHRLMDRLFEWLNGPEFQAPDKSDASMSTVYAILRSVVAHLYMAWIHPFGDGNGRSARMLEFHILMSSGVPSPAAHLLSNHYNQTRSEYYRQLDYASKSGGDIVPFIKYAVQGFVDGLRAQIEYVWNQQWDVTWRNYVHERFQAKNSDSDIRQRHLILDLGEKREWIEVGEIPELTTRLAKAYATKTMKTIQRDLNVLSEMGLVKRDANKVKAEREIILAFLPLRKK